MTYYKVMLSVKGDEALLKPGMTAKVLIETAKHNNVLLVPATAVKRKKGGQQHYVQVLRNGKPEEADVTTGLVNDEKAEIVNGLNPGEQVVVPKTKQDRN